MFIFYHIIYTPMLYVDDFGIGEANVTFTPDSDTNSTCFTFTPVDDAFIEDSESFTFSPVAMNELDTFQDDSSEFSLVISDDDGKVERVV